MKTSRSLSLIIASLLLSGLAAGSIAGDFHAGGPAADARADTADPPGGPHGTGNSSGISPAGTARSSGVAPSDAAYPSGASVLEKIDENMSSENRVLTSKMIIHGRRSSRTVESKSWIAGEEKSFTEYLAPAREKGTKMLKLEDKLWMYSPSTDRTIQISGHMLRQSVMGSDLSYEDMMEDPRLANHYDAEVTGLETIDGRDCWVLSLTARTEDITYQSRRMWVDCERHIPLKEDLFAKSGKLLKRTELSDVTKLEGRWFPMRVLFKDMLKTGRGTEFVVETIEFDVEIPAHVFTKAALR